MSSNNEYDIVKKMFDHAIVEANASPDTRQKVGAVIATGDLSNIISTGWNGRPVVDKDFNKCVNPKTSSSFPQLIHAEERAIIKAGFDKCTGATIFVTHCPCLRCAARIIESGIKRVYFMKEHDELEGAEYLLANGIEVSQVPFLRRTISPNDQFLSELVPGEVKSLKETGK